MLQKACDSFFVSENPGVRCLLPLSNQLAWFPSWHCEFQTKQLTLLQGPFELSCFKLWWYRYSTINSLGSLGGKLLQRQHINLTFKWRRFGHAKYNLVYSSCIQAYCWLSKFRRFGIHISSNFDTASDRNHMQDLLRPVWNLKKNRKQFWQRTYVYGPSLAPSN